MKRYVGLIAGLLPLMALLPAPRANAQLVMTGGYYVVLNGGTQFNPTSLVLSNPAPTAISNTGTAWIISEGEFNQVAWDIGTNTGAYVVPFGYGTTQPIPITCNITTAGVGNGVIKFATYHGATWNNTGYKPSDVTGMTDFGAADYSNNTVDRFWIVDAYGGYTTRPTANLTFTYLRNGGSSEIAAPNFIVEKDLIAQRFNSSTNVWNDFLGAINMDVTSVNTGIVSTGNIAPSNLFRSWALMNDSDLVDAGIPEINNAIGIQVYPNPSRGNITIVVSGADKSTFEVYDVLGQQLFAHSLVSGSNNVAMGTKANGVYLYRIISDSGNLMGQGKLIIQK